MSENQRLNLFGEIGMVADDFMLFEPKMDSGSETPSASNKIPKEQLIVRARKFYRLMMNETTMEVFEVLGSGLKRSSMNSLSSAMKTLNCCAMYLLIVDFCRLESPTWLLLFIRHAFDFGDSVQATPNGLDLISRFGSLSRAEIIDAHVSAALKYLNRSDSEKIRLHLREFLENGSKKNLEILQKCLIEPMPSLQAIR